MKAFLKAQQAGDALSHFFVVEMGLALVFSPNVSCHIKNWEMPCDNDYTNGPHLKWFAGLKEKSKED